MDINTPISVGAICTVLGAIGVVYGIVKNKRECQKAESEAREKELEKQAKKDMDFNIALAKIDSSLNEITNKMNTTQLSVDRLSDRLNEMSTNMSVHNERFITITQRLDSIESRVAVLEENERI